MSRVLWLMAICLFLPYQTFAAEKVTHVKVNGFTVYLVDLEKGNQFGYTFAVPYGSSDDEPAQFGRAHFFEHMFARGSKRYPGHETLIKAMSGFGFERNAATGMDLTFYYATGNEAHGLEALDMHLASLEEPDLEASSLTREKATVVNEIITSAPNRPIRAIFTLPFMTLPDLDHPGRGQYTGTHETLDPMSADDLRELHRRIYHAGNVEVAVFANFSTGTLSRERVIEALTKSLPKAESTPAPYVPAPRGPLFAKDQVLEILNANDRVGMIFLPVADGADLTAVRALLGVFTNSFRNGIQDIAERQMGWASNIDAELMRIGPDYFVGIDFRMTDLGYAHRDEIVQWLMNSLRTCKDIPFPESVLSQKREAWLYSLKRSESDLDSLVRTFPSWMTEPGFADQLRFDWPATVAHINAKTLKQGAEAIRFSEKAVCFMGPDATLAKEEDPFHGLKYGIRPWQDVATLSVPALNPQSIDVPQVKIASLPTSGPQLFRNEWHAVPGWTIVHGHESDWKDRSVLLRLQFGSLTPLEQLSLNAYVYAVGDELQQELAVLRARGLSLSVSSEPGELLISAHGPSGEEAAGIVWLFDKLNQFTPNDKVVARYRESAALSLQRSEEGFPTQAAISLIRDILSARESGPLALRQSIAAVSTKSVSDFLSHERLQSHKILSFAGPSTQTEVYALMSAAGKFSPLIWDEQPSFTLPGVTVQTTAEYHEGWETLTGPGIGVVRAFPGPTAANIEDKAALAIISDALHDQVFLRNRPLGYAHGVGQMASSPTRSHIVVYGQVNSSAQLGTLQAVWDDEITRWKTGQIESETIEKSRQGLIASMSKDQASSEDGLGHMNVDLKSSGNPFYSEQLLQTLKLISKEKILEAARRYLGDDQPRLTVYKGGVPAQSCEDMLRQRTALRATVGGSGL